jgi:flagella basal body P-ring formation protein FlgA
MRSPLFILVLVVPLVAASAAVAADVQMREVARIQDRLTIGDVAHLTGDAAALQGRTLVTRDPDKATVDDVVRALVEAGLREDRLYLRGPVLCRIVRAQPPRAAPARQVADEWGVLVEAPVPVFVEEPVADVDLADTLRAAAAAGLNLDLVDVTVRLPAYPAGAALIDRPVIDRLGRHAVRIHTPHRGEQRINVEIGAEAERLVITRPIRRGQAIRPDDIEATRVPIESLDETALDLMSAVGQEASRDLQPGQVLTPSLLAARKLVERGQLLIVTHRRGGVTLRTRALSRGTATYGQTVRANCQATGRDLLVKLTGPQAGTVLDQAEVLP